MVKWVYLESWDGIDNTVLFSYSKSGDFFQIVGSLDFIFCVVTKLLRNRNSKIEVLSEASLSLSL